MAYLVKHKKAFIQVPVVPVTALPNSMVRHPPQSRQVWSLALPACLVAFVLLAPAATAYGGSPAEEVMTADFWVGVGVATLLALALAAVTRAPLRRPLLLLWGAKALVALGFMLWYEDHYSGRLDAFSYFDGVNPDSPSSSAVPHGTAFVIFLSSIIQEVAGPSYHAVKVVFAFIGLIGLVLLVQATRRRWPDLPSRILLLVGLFPGVLFWSSIIGKEPLMLLALGLVAHGLVSARRGLSQVAFVAGGVLLAYQARAWMGIILGVPTMILALRNGLATLFPGHPWTRRVTWSIAIACALLGLLAMASGGAALLRDRLNATRAAEAGIGGSSLPAPPFDSFADMLVFWPFGAFTALFRPLPGEALSAGFFGLLAGLEGGLLIALTLRAVRRGRPSDLRDAWAGWMVAVIGLWLALYAYLSSINLGTAMRYRLQILPLLLLLLFRAGRPRDRADPMGAGLEVKGPPKGGLERVDDRPDGEASQGMLARGRGHP